MKILLAFCEGPHDVAFLSRVLCANDFTDISRSLPLKDYPNEIKSFFIGQRQKMGFKEVDNELAHLHEMSINVLLPSVLVNRKIDMNANGKLREIPNFSSLSALEDKCIFLFSVKGLDNLATLPKPIIQHFAGLAKNTQEENSLVPNLLNISIALIPDADAKGIAKTKEELEAKYKEFIKGLPINSFEIFVLAGEDGFGCLENIMLPLIEECSNTNTEKDPMLLNVKEFIETNKPLIWKEDTVQDKTHKATINIIGQFEKGLTGYSNAVIIAGTRKYLNDNIIRENEKCQEIYRFFDEMLSVL